MCILIENFILILSINKNMNHELYYIKLPYSSERHDPKKILDINGDVSLSIIQSVGIYICMAGS